MVGNLDGSTVFNFFRCFGAQKGYTLAGSRPHKIRIVRTFGGSNGPDHLRIPEVRPLKRSRRGVHGVCPAKGFPQLIDHLQSHDLLAIGSRGVIDGIYYILYIFGDIMGYSATASHLGSEDDSSNSSPCGSTFSGKWWSTMITQSGFLKGTSGQIEKSRALWNQNGREEHEKCDASWWGHSSKLGSQTTLVGFYMKLSNSGEIWSWTTPTLRYICAVTNILTSTLVFILTHSLTCTVTFFLTYTLTYT